MGDLGPVLAAIAVTVIGSIGAWLSARRLRKLGFGDDRAKLNAGLRELADLWEAKFNLERAAVTAEMVAHAATKADLTFNLQLCAQCRSDLDDARSKIRLLEQRKPRAGA